LPKLDVEPGRRLLSTAAVVQGIRREIRQSKGIIQLTHHLQATIGTELRALKFQAHSPVKTEPRIIPFACTLRAIHNPPLSAHLNC
jgi:hypothetical protein